MLFFISSSFAEDLSRESNFKGDSYVFEAEGKFHSFKLHQKQKFYLSTHCTKKENNCLAKEALFNKIKPKKEISLTGGVNLGTVLCVNYLSGNLLTMKNKNGHHVAVCEFSDKSKISTGILEKLLIDQ